MSILSEQPPWFGPSGYSSREQPGLRSTRRTSHRSAGAATVRRPARLNSDTSRSTVPTLLPDQIGCCRRSATDLEVVPPHGSTGHRRSRSPSCRSRRTAEPRGIGSAPRCARSSTPTESMSRTIAPPHVTPEPSDDTSPGSAPSTPVVGASQRSHNRRQYDQGSRRPSEPRRRRHGFFSFRFSSNLNPRTRRGGSSHITAAMQHAGSRFRRRGRVRLPPPRGPTTLLLGEPWRLVGGHPCLVGPAMSRSRWMIDDLDHPSRHPRIQFHMRSNPLLWAEVSEIPIRPTDTMDHHGTQTRAPDPGRERTRTYGLRSSVRNEALSGTTS